MEQSYKNEDWYPKPMCEEDLNRILAHPNVITTTWPVFELEGKKYPVYSERFLTIDDMLKSFDGAESVYLYPQGLKIQHDPICPPQYWARVRRIKQ